jgi:hypothetical protein
MKFTLLSRSLSPDSREIRRRSSSPVVFWLYKRRRSFVSFSSDKRNENKDDVVTAHDAIQFYMFHRLRLRCSHEPFSAELVDMFTHMMQG